MRGNLKKVIGIIFIIILTSLCFITESEAASFSITSGISEIEIGKSYTISISASGLTGRFNITHSSNVSVNMDSIWVENGSPEGTIEVTANSTGRATVTLTPDEEYGVSDSTGLVTLSAQTDTVTVKANETSSGGDSEGNNNSGGNSSKPSDTEEEAPSISFSSRNETVYATSSVNVRSSCSTSSNKNIIGSLDIGDSVTRTGIGSGWSRITYNGQTAYVSSDYLDTKNPIDTEKEQEPEEEEEKENEEEKSNVKTLKSLTVERFTLEPEFDPNITEYSLTVGADVEKLDIGVIAEDPKSTVEIVGNNELLIGENTVNVKVTAEDGTVRTYTINVTKVADVGVKLSELSIESYTLSPEFSSDVFEYTLNITDTSITNLAINAKSDEENVDIEIVGNNELKLGKNIITILVTSKNDNLTTTYQIVVNIEETQPENNQIIAGIDNNDLFMYIGIGVVVLVILIIIIVVIVRKRRNAKETDDYDDEEDFAPLNTYSLENISNDEKSEKLENTDLNSNKDTTITDNAEQDNENKRKEKLDEFSSYASSSDSDANTTTRKRGKHF